MARRHRHPLRLLAGLAALGAARCAFGFGFVVNDDVRGAWNNTLAVGAAIRANNPDPQFVGATNANQYPSAKGAVSSADDGNLNFRKGDVTTAPLLLISDFELRYRNEYGVFARAGLVRPAARTTRRAARPRGQRLCAGREA